uniref:FGGY carbohydrate kinase domain containing n=1 Tax=Rousettus aegyptiacus TaxID=9407 RepID=A0A7J8K8F1_ROUAE|nr:FGGY carbohydrate kinase domain containing [Rousettus aegyptiacus]
MWLDHRAVSQVHRINETKHSVLQYVGGVMSVEMQAPKLLWLKENLRETCWDKAGHFFDLPDFLSWKATGVTARSLCSLVCKWTYSAERGWDDSFWKMIGLEDFVADNYSKIGNQVLPPGASLGNGLTPEAAKDLGLPAGIAVAASLIDAHAGGLVISRATVSIITHTQGTGTLLGLSYAERRGLHLEDLQHLFSLSVPQTSLSHFKIARLGKRRHGSKHSLLCPTLPAP